MKNLITFPQPTDLSAQPLTVVMTSEQIKVSLIALAVLDNLSKIEAIKPYVDVELKTAAHSCAFAEPDLTDKYIDTVLGLAFDQLFNVYYNKREDYYESNSQSRKYRHPFFDLEKEAVLKLRAE